jgi:hypothetical protein
MENSNKVALFLFLIDKPKMALIDGSIIVSVID